MKMETKTTKCLTQNDYDALLELVDRKVRECVENEQSSTLKTERWEWGDLASFYIKLSRRLENTKEKSTKLENYEETLGIDLRDLLAILTGSIFVNTELGIYELSGSMCYIGRKDKALCCYFDAHGKFLPFKDYGTYWSANREDVVKWRKENGWE